jgi:hypothetical protein
MTKTQIGLFALDYGFRASYSGKNRTWYFHNLLKPKAKQISRKVGKSGLGGKTIHQLLTNA